MRVVGHISFSNCNCNVVVCVSPQVCKMAITSIKMVWWLREHGWVHALSSFIIQHSDMRGFGYTVLLYSFTKTSLCVFIRRTYWFSQECSRRSQESQYLCVNLDEEQCKPISKKYSPYLPWLAFWRDTAFNIISSLDKETSKASIFLVSP